MKKLLILFLLISTISYGQIPSLVASQSNAYSPVAPEGTAILSNFAVYDSEKSNVYFDSDTNISTLTSAGFSISQNTISSLTIDGDNLGGYFTVGTPLTFWDNNTIRLESGNGTAYDFTLTHVVNNINEPPATTNIYYVKTAADGGSNAANGLTEGTAWATMSYAETQVTAGSTVYVKAGVYTQEHFLVGVTGNIDAPIKYIGYKTLGVEITSNYYSGAWAETYGKHLTLDGIDSAEMPTLDGVDYSGVGIASGVMDGGSSTPANNQGDGYYYRIFRNFNIMDYLDGVALIDNVGYILERVNTFNNGGDLVAGLGNGFSLDGFWTDEGDQIAPFINMAIQRKSDSRLIDCVVKNATANGLDVYGKGNLYKDCKVYAMDGYVGQVLNNPTDSPSGLIDETTYPAYPSLWSSAVALDYSIILGGTDNIVIGCYMMRNDNNAHGSYFGVKSTDDGWNGKEDASAWTEGYRNLFDGNETDWIFRAMKARNPGTRYSVFKNNKIHNGGISIFGGTKDNIWEHNSIDGDGTGLGIEIYNNQEGHGTTLVGKVSSGNIIRNNFFSGFEDFIRRQNVDTPNSITVENNYFQNNTIVGGTYFFDMRDAAVIGSNNYFTNNIILSSTSKDHPTVGVADVSGSDWIFDNNDFWLNGWTTGIGTNSLNLDPSFNGTTDYTQYVPATQLDGIAISSIKLDFNYQPKLATPQMGFKNKL